MTETAQIESTARDFDFWHGTWKVRNRRLKRRLAGSDDWEEFDATATARPLLDGWGNEDEFRTDHEGGFVGMSFRFFELDSPVHGVFSGDIGLFHGEDVHRGRPVLVRFTWSGVTTDTPRWEQAFSDDGGRTWETNWVMDFTRAEEDA
jgi:hypothetical protein